MLARSVKSAADLMAVPLSRVLKALWDWAPAALATALVVLVYLRAIMAVDTDYDSIAYHIPFSALRVGLMSHWQFQRGPAETTDLTAYYKGFPILADLVRGWMWKLSGRPEATNLFGISMLVLLVGYLRWAFRVPASWAFIGLFAIPAVQTAASGSLVDVPASAAFAIFLFSICDLWVNPAKFRQTARWVVLFLAAFAAANIKMQTSVFVCLAMPLVLPPTWRLLRQSRARWPAIAGAGLGLVCGALLIEYNLVRNLLHHGNPFWPIALTIGRIHFVGPMAQDAWLVPNRPYAWLPQSVQWLISVLEFHSLDGRSIPYTNGMGSVAPNALSNYMGGFFSGLVVAALAFFIVGVRKRWDRLSFCFLGVLIYLTIIVAPFPNSQCLRYVMFWMMFLVIGGLILLQSPRLEPYLQSYKITLVAALVFVTSVTGGVYFIPVWLPMQAYVDGSGAEQILERIVKPGDVICLDWAQGYDHRSPIQFAPIFHRQLNQERPYGVREGPNCEGFKKAPAASR